MKLEKLIVEPLHIPFKTMFEHSSARRCVTETVIVKAKTSNGIYGMGEGCPRQYVTGETIESAVAFIEDHRNRFLGIGSLSELESWISDNSVKIDCNPAAFCAVELALLNALAGEKRCSTESVLGLAELTGRFHYSGVLGTGNSSDFHDLLQKYLAMGIRDFKVKLFGNPDVDRTNLDAIRVCGQKQLRVRFDANNLWTSPDAATDYIRALDFPVFALEEPISVNDYAGMVEISNALGSKIILDESFRGPTDFDQIHSNSRLWIINIRISKMGGVLRSLKVVDKARAFGIPVIIGAQAGETSVLTRSAITVASACRDILVAQEGAFGTYLLEHDIIDPPIMFGQGGVVDAGQL